jgi:hypothetical protein
MNCHVFPLCSQSLASGVAIATMYFVELLTFDVLSYESDYDYNYTNSAHFHQNIQRKFIFLSLYHMAIERLPTKMRHYKNDARVN